jgi:hypothetical protein
MHLVGEYLALAQLLKLWGGYEIGIVFKSYQSNEEK